MTMVKDFDGVREGFRAVKAARAELAKAKTEGKIRIEEHKADKVCALENMLCDMLTHLLGQRFQGKFFYSVHRAELHSIWALFEPASGRPIIRAEEVLNHLEKARGLRPSGIPVLTAPPLNPGDDRRPIENIDIVAKCPNCGKGEPCECRPSEKAMARTDLDPLAADVPTIEEVEGTRPVGLLPICPGCMKVATYCGCTKEQRKEGLERLMDHLDKTVVPPDPERDRTHPAHL